MIPELREVEAVQSSVSAEEVLLIASNDPCAIYKSDSSCTWRCTCEHVISTYLTANGRVPATMIPLQSQCITLICGPYGGPVVGKW